LNFVLELIVVNKKKTLKNIEGFRVAQKSMDTWKAFFVIRVSIVGATTPLPGKEVELCKN